MSNSSNLKNLNQNAHHKSQQDIFYVISTRVSTSEYLTLIKGIIQVYYSTHYRIVLYKF